MSATQNGNITANIMPTPISTMIKSLQV